MSIENSFQNVLYFLSIILSNSADQCFVFSRVLYCLYIHSTSFVSLYERPAAVAAKNFQGVAVAETRAFV